MFSFFKKQQPFNIIIAKNLNLNPTFEKDLKLFILQVYNRDFFLKKIKSVTFMVTSDDRYQAKVDFDNSSYDKCIIYLSIKSLISLNNPNELMQKVHLLLNHEITHLKHYFHGDKFLKMIKNRYKLSVASNKQLNPNFNDLRTKLHDILILSFQEGLARFYETNKEYTLDELDKLYSESLDFTLKIHKVLLDKIENGSNNYSKQELNYIINYPYNFGLVMIYTILMGIENINQIKLFDLTPFKAFKLYEKAVFNLNSNYSKNYKILFSYASKNGIIDYSNLVNLISKNNSFKNNI